jgi:bifunctional UDP-N-acetylglucosamine pyrophosphorylase/glucosamine-1-phosphate N-acetyltransferase
LLIEVKRMKVVFLCGGIGKRMLPITEDKFFIEFLGKTLLEHQIERAGEAGLREFIIVSSPTNTRRIEQITAGLSGVRIELAVQKEALGIADALRSASELFEGEIIIVNPNDIFDSSAYTDILTAYDGNSAGSYLLGYQVSDYFPGGYLLVDEQAYLKHIVEKPERGKEPGKLVNVMVHLHSNPARLLEYIKQVKTNNDDVYECALDSMAQEQQRIKVIAYDGFWQAIKYPWHIFGAVRYFLDKSEPYVSPSAQVSPRAVVEGKVILGDKVRVLENAVIRGPAYIGRNSVIGNNVLIRDYSHIGADCVIGYGTEVKASYIGNNCWFHSNYIGDSIIGNDCSFGAGTVLANFRFDEGSIKARVQGKLVDTGRDKFGAIIGDNSKTGIHASILPGLKIGPNSFVGPHVCLTRDLGPHKIILAEPSGRVIENTIKLDEKKMQEMMRRLQCAE